MNASSDSTPLNRNKASFALLLASMFWGFGFVGTVWALRGMDTYWVCSLRFLIVVALLAPRYGFFFRVPELRREFSLAFLPAFLLVLTLVLQTAGLHYTTATKSGFITTLYVVFVALLESLLLRRLPTYRSVIWIVLGLLGTYLICGASFSDWNIGDSLTLACSLGAAAQIIAIGRVSARLSSTPFRFSYFQAIWAGLLPLPLALIFEAPPVFPMDPLVLAGLLSLSIFSSLLAFGLQVIGQASLSATTASLVCLLESPFSAAFAFLLLGESLSPTQWVGAFVILIAAVGAIRYR